MPSYSHQNRRQFLQTIGFSAAALLGRGQVPHSLAEPAVRSDHLFLFGDWGAWGDTQPQQQVATAMASYASGHGIRPSALMLLGDNFYGQFDGGVNSPRWQAQFEEMYPAAAFPGPCYAILGNHDYNVEPAGKCEAQLAYSAAHPGTRWNLPAKWYRLDLPRERPLVTFLMLDSNYQKAIPEKPSLLEEERAAQAAWLRAELAKPRETRFLVVCGHHPLYSNAGDGQVLIHEWDALLREHRAHLYVCGHIHDLEHLEFEGHPTSFIVTGGGGTTIRRGHETKSSAASQFGHSVHGFTHLEINEEHFTVRHLGVDGLQLHAFTKSAAGKVQPI